MPLHVSTTISAPPETERERETDRDKERERDREREREMMVGGGGQNLFGCGTVFYLLLISYCSHVPQSARRTVNIG